MYYREKSSSMIHVSLVSVKIESTLSLRAIFRWVDHFKLKENYVGKKFPHINRQLKKIEKKQIMLHKQLWVILKSLPRFTKM